jgi:hypothetical protein
MSSIGGVKISKQARAERAQRFAADSAAPPPPPPERRFAHPDFDRSSIQRSDPEKKLVALCRRKLTNGEALTPPQLAALARLGLTPEAVLAEAEQLEASPPAIYRELGAVPPTAAPAALKSGADPKRRGKSASAKARSR